MLSYSDFMKAESRANGDDLEGLTTVEIKARRAAEKAYAEVMQAEEYRLEMLAVEEECWTGDFRDDD